MAVIKEITLKNITDDLGTCLFRNDEGKIIYGAQEAYVGLGSNTIEVMTNLKVTFHFTFKDIAPNEPAPTKIIYSVYSSILGKNTVDAIQLTDQHREALLEDGCVTFRFPEHMAGSIIAISFGLVNPIHPLPGISQNTVKYLKIKSSILNAPCVTNVYWTDKEKIRWGQIEVNCSSRGNNQHAFLHIHTAGLFGKRVAVELYGSGKLLRKKIYTVLDNVLSVAFPMSNLQHWHINQNGNQEQIRTFTAKVFEEGNEEKAKSSGTLTLDTENDAKEESSSLYAATSKFVIGEMPVAEEVTDDTPQEAPLAEGLNVHVGTFSFLSGTGTLSSEENKISSKPLADQKSDTKMRYYTYPMDTYGLYLQDLIDAGLVSKSEVVKTENGVDTLNTENVYKEEYTKEDRTTTFIYGLTQNFKDKVQKRMSIKKNMYKGLDYAQLRSILHVLKKKETTPDTRQFCRSAWQLKSGNSNFARFKHATFRYAGNQECPPGAYYIVPCDGNAYLLYVGQIPTSNANIQYYTCTTLTADDTVREQIVKPNNTKRDYEKCPRGGIAFHRGRSVSSTGCITLDGGYNEKSCMQEEVKFFNHIFSGKNGEYKEKALYESVENEKGDIINSKKHPKVYDTAKPTKKTANTLLKLHLLTIEERAAALRDDCSDTDPDAFNRYQGQ